MKSLLIAIALGGIVLTGCSRGGGIPEDQRLRNAPTEDSKTGILVLGAQESALSKLANENSNILIRPINTKHGIYEVHGVNEEGLRKTLGPNPEIHQNKYRNTKPRKLSNTLNLLDLSFDDEFIGSCRNFRADEELFNVELQNEIDKFEISHIYELGETVQGKFSSKKTMTYLWKIEPPKSLGLEEVSNQGEMFEYTPKVNGEHTLTVLAKTEFSDCLIQKKSVYVTANTKLDPSSRLTAEAKADFDIFGFWHLEFLNLPALWEVSTGEDVVIAVIDTGVNYNHESLNENIFINSQEIPGNNIDDDMNGYVDDAYGFDFASSDPFPFDDIGHGSHVAGLAAASTFGIAKNAQIMPLKTITGLGTDVGSFVGAIYYAVDNGAQIINASFGWKEDHPIFRKAMEYARDKGIIVVTASGNGDGNGRPVDNDLTPSYPTTYDHPNIISVAATDEDNDLAPYSNFGATSVDIATFGGAPWLELFSTSHQYNGGREYVPNIGTSQAAPIVSGAAALLIASNPELKANEIKDILIKSAQPNESLNGKVVSGGILNLSAALELVARPMSSP